MNLFYLAAIKKGIMCTSFNDENVTENRKLVEQAKTFFYSVLSPSVES